MKGMVVVAALGASIAWVASAARRPVRSSAAVPLGSPDDLRSVELLARDFATAGWVT